MYLGLCILFHFFISSSFLTLETATNGPCREVVLPAAVSKVNHELKSLKKKKNILVASCNWKPYSLWIQNNHDKQKLCCLKHELLQWFTWFPQPCLSLSHTRDAEIACSLFFDTAWWPNSYSGKMKIEKKSFTFNFANNMALGMAMSAGQLVSPPL